MSVFHFLQCWYFKYHNKLKVSVILHEHFIFSSGKSYGKFIFLPSSPMVRTCLGERSLRSVYTHSFILISTAPLPTIPRLSSHILCSLSTITVAIQNSQESIFEQAGLLMTRKKMNQSLSEIVQFAPLYLQRLES